MKTNLTVCLTLCIPALAGAAEPSLATLEEQFREVPMEARRLTGPLFWMHGDETKAQLEGELQNVLAGHNGTFTAGPRAVQDERRRRTFVFSFGPADA